MAGLKKARRQKAKDQYKTRQITPQRPAPQASPAPAANPFVMGTSNYGTPPKE